MGHDRIIKECAAGKYFDTQVRRYASLVYNDVFFVDRAAGTDGSDGKSWDTARKTITGIDSLLTDNARDAIVFRGRITGSQKFDATPAQEITKAGAKLLGAAYLFGAGGGQESCILGADTPTGTSNASLSGWNAVAYLVLGANDIELAGLKFFGGYSEMNTNAWMVTNDDNRGINHSIHHCMFCGDVDGGSTSADGLGLVGLENGYVGYNTFRASKYAIALRGDGNRYSNGSIVEFNRLQAPKYGVYLDAATTECFIEGILINPKSIIGHALSGGIQTDADADGNLIVDCVVRHATGTTAYVEGGTNTFVNCKYGTTSGALTVFPS